LISKSGHQLLADDAVDVLRDRLLPLATLVTPNLPEAARLVDFAIVDDDSAVRAGRLLIAAGASAALIKGGHGEGNVVTDLLVTATEVVPFSSARVHTEHTHGTGCTLSSAIASNLALGKSLVDAVGAAIDYVHKAIVFAPGLGHGHGPLHHLHPFDPPVSSGDFQ
ncbi:MAG TPA: PfkB family carbohydrate kinase, partial [Myxococcota bacterium]